MSFLPPGYADYASYFKEALCFLRNYSWVYNFAVTDLLVLEVLEKIPSDWVKVLLALSNEELNQLPQGLTKDEWPVSLISFSQQCQKLQVSVREAVKQERKLPDEIRRGLTPKKEHEVCSLAAFVHEECTASGITQILDVGSGLGYLDQLLNFLYGYNVVGLESQPEHVRRASARQQKLDSTPAVTHITCNVSSDSKHTILSALHDPDQPTCMAGLHACGDLTVDSFRIFVQLECLRLFILVPCCYHKMTVVKGREFSNFPLSSELRKFVHSDDTQTFLYRPFLRLASQQSAVNWQRMTPDEHLHHSVNMMARAVLQLFAHKEGLTLKKIRRRAVQKKNRNTFKTFLEDALQRYEFIPKSACDSSFHHQIAELWEEHKDSCPLAEVLIALQTMMQAMAECFVLVDRAAYLEECGVKALELVKVMDEDVSPRCYAIVGRK